MMPQRDDPHGDVPIERAGAELGAARAAVVLVHGRGASAASMLSLARELDVPGVAFLAPQAAGHVWYPQSFLAPLARNQPGLDSGLRTLGRTVATAEDAGVATHRIVVLGFSQGACLGLEYAARRGRPLGGVLAWSGGLIGTGERAGVAPPEDKLFDYDGDLADTPVFLGCSDVDAHIPVARVHQSASVFEQLGADVTKRLYPGMGHTVNRDEIDFAHALLTRLANASEDAS